MIRLFLLTTVLALTSGVGLAQAPASAPSSPSGPITAAEVKNVDTPSAAARLKGDPDGGLPARFPMSPWPIPKRA